MNAFRATILAFLIVAVGMLAYFVCVSQPAMHDQNEAYQASLRSDAAQAGTEAAPVTQTSDPAVKDEVAAQLEEQKNLEFKEAEKLALKKAEQERQARERQAQQERTQDNMVEVAEIPVAGRVYTFSEYEAVVTIEESTPGALAGKTDVVIFHEGQAIAEASIVDKDEEHNLYFAFLKEVNLSAKKHNANPQQGDQVKVVDLPSADDLRSGRTQPAPAPEVQEEEFDPTDDAKFEEVSNVVFDTTDDGQTASENTPAQEEPAPAPKEEPADDLPDLPEEDATLTPVP